MHYFGFPSKDSTLYEVSSSMNTSLDEILEVRKDMNADGTVINTSRILIKFDLTYISESVASGLITSGSNTKFYLNLYDANSTDLNISQTLYGYPVSQSWSNGSGKHDSNPVISDGVGWKWKDDSTTRTQWNAVSQSGGTWYSGSGYEASQSFTHEPADLRMDVTDIAWKWLHSTVPNEGFMLKRSGSIGNTDSNLEEGNTTRYGHFSFFSSNTHTIYPPKLEVVWDDSSWSTGSLAPLTGSALEDTVLYFKGLREEYKQNSKVRFRVVGRERYPAKTFATSSANIVTKYLPSGSQVIEHGTYYSVKDSVTEDVIVPFGTGSIVSCDTTGNYFNVWMNGFQPERYYKFEIRVATGSRSSATQIVNYYDDDWTFKVTR